LIGEYTYFQGTHPSDISRERFESIQVLLAQAKNKTWKVATNGECYPVIFRNGR